LLVLVDRAERAMRFININAIVDDGMHKVDRHLNDLLLASGFAGNCDCAAAGSGLGGIGVVIDPIMPPPGTIGETTPKGHPANGAKAKICLRLTIVVNPP
jgi:hypothetical protein